MDPIWTALALRLPDLTELSHNCCMRRGLQDQKAAAATNTVLSTQRCMLEAAAALTVLYTSAELFGSSANGWASVLNTH